jgi:hypothetical protein
MRKHSSEGVASDFVQTATRKASFGLHYVIDELRLLMSGFPDTKEAFDPDELPLTFILRRDSRRTERAAHRQQTAGTPSLGGNPSE